MSVLYKALQKAEKENEQRQTSASGKGFDAERLAGSGAIRVARGHGINWRVAGMGSIGLLGILVLGLYFVTQPQTAPQPRLATLTVPPKGAPEQKAPPTEESRASDAQLAVAPTQTPAPAQPASEKAASSESTPAQTAPSPSPQSAPAAAQPAEPQVAQAPAASASAGAAPPRSSPAQASTPAPAATSPSQESPKPAAPAVPPQTELAEAEAPAGSPTKPAAAKPPMPVREKPIEIPADSPAQALNPPISIARSDYALSGVGRAVQVRQIAQEAQDNVGAGYNALLRGEYDTALGFYDHALEKEPTSVLGLLGRGAALQKLHRLEDAQEAYTKALKVDPENREALTNITSIIADRAPAEALNRLLELEKTYPAFSPIKAQIGLLYAKAGSMEQALDYLRRAIALSPDSVMYQYNFALVLDHMNLREQAIDAYQRVLGAIALKEAPPELSSTEIERRVRFLRVR